MFLLITAGRGGSLELSLWLRGNPALLLLLASETSPDIAQAFLLILELALHLLYNRERKLSIHLYFA